MRADRFIAWKFMLKGTEKGTFSPMTVFAWLALGVGVWAMGSLLSVMFGFEGALKERVLTAYPHLLIRPQLGQGLTQSDPIISETLQNTEGVRTVIPYLESEMIFQSEYRTLGGVVQGIPFEALEKKAGAIKEGKLPDPKADRPQVLVGRELARRMGLGIGETLQVISPVETTGAFGIVPRAATFEVAGLFESGHYQFDQQYLYLVLSDAQQLLKARGQVSGWQVWGPSYDESEALADRVREQIPHRVESWTVFNEALFQSLKLEQFAMSFIFGFALLIAVMNIAITLMMGVVQKRTNIGILRAMGASKKQIRKIFVWQGLWIGFSGLLFGGVCTTLTLVYIKYFMNFQLPDIYYDRSIPIEVRPWSLVAIYGVAVVLVYLSTLYPARRAMNTHPIEAIRG